MKKLPVVKAYNIYKVSDCGMHFAFVRVEGDARMQVTSFFTCREELASAARCSLNVDLNNMRLLVTMESSKFSKEALWSARSALRLCEEYAGWNERSVITTVNHEREGLNCYLITGPGEWMSHPQLLSIATLLIRAIARNRTAKTDDWETFDTWVKQLIEEHHKSGDPDPNGDVSALSMFWEKIKVVLKHNREIFEVVEDPWPETDDLDNGADSTDFAEDCGIASFINRSFFHSDDLKTARQIFENLWVENYSQAAAKAA